MSESPASAQSPPRRGNAAVLPDSIKPCSTSRGPRGRIRVLSHLKPEEGLLKNYSVLGRRGDGNYRSLFTQRGKLGLYRGPTLRPPGPVLSCKFFWFLGLNEAPVRSRAGQQPRASRGPLASFSERPASVSEPTCPCEVRRGVVPRAWGISCAPLLRFARAASSTAGGGGGRRSQTLTPGWDRARGRADTRGRRRSTVCSPVLSPSCSSQGHPCPRPGLKPRNEAEGPLGH